MGNFYRHLTIFDGHTGGDPSLKVWILSRTKCLMSYLSHYIFVKFCTFYLKRLKIKWAFEFAPKNQHCKSLLLYNAIIACYLFKECQHGTLTTPIGSFRRAVFSECEWVDNCGAENETIFYLCFRKFWKRLQRLSPSG